MSIKTNEFGEVISVNGLTTGHHLGAPMQDAVAEKPEDNEVYATERNTVTRNSNVKEDEQPTPTGGGSGGSGGEKVYYIWETRNPREGTRIIATDGIYEAIKKNVYDEQVGINVKILRYEEDDPDVQVSCVSRFTIYPEEEIIEVTPQDGRAAYYEIRKNGEHSYYDG